MAMADDFARLQEMPRTQDRNVNLQEASLAALAAFFVCGIAGFVGISLTLASLAG